MALGWRRLGSYNPEEERAGQSVGAKQIGPECNLAGGFVWWISFLHFRIRIRKGNILESYTYQQKPTADARDHFPA